MPVWILHRVSMGEPTSGPQTPVPDGSFLGWDHVFGISSLTESGMASTVTAPISAFSSPSAGPPPPPALIATMTTAVTTSAARAPMSGANLEPGILPGAAADLVM